MTSVTDRVENTLGKAENTGYQHFLHAHFISKASSFWVIKTEDCVEKIDKSLAKY